MRAAEGITRRLHGLSNPESTAQWVQAEMAKWEPIVREAGIKRD